MTKSKRRKKEYKRDHLIAKFIISTIVSLLFILSKVTGFIVLDIIGIYVWFFGVNPVQYIIEKLDKHSHKVELL